MRIYKHRATVTTASGTVGSASLNISGGLYHQLLIRANVATTLFRADITDENSIIIRNYGYHSGEINDIGFFLPLAGVTTINITNASPNDTFTVLLSVAE